MIDNRNLLLAVAVSLAILIGFEYLVLGPDRQRLLEQQAQQQSLEPAGDANVPRPSIGDAPTVPGAPAIVAAPGMTRDAALAAAPRIAVSSPNLRGSISLKGARIDDLILTRYRKSLEKGSPQIELLSPPGSEGAFYADFGWSAAVAGTSLPNGETLWEADRDSLTPEQPVTLSWDNGQGLRFEKIIALDKGYMFTVTQRVVNKSGEAVTLSPFALISRSGHPDILGFYILHEGLMAGINGALEEVNYSDVEDAGEIKYDTTGGWIGITDKYWQAMLVPDQSLQVDARFIYIGKTNPGKYQSDILYNGLQVPAGGTAENTTRLFAGAKEVDWLDRYTETYGIPLFDRSVDFGWFFYLTKPFFYLLHYFANLFGNFGLAILMVTVLVKIVFFPLANKSYASMAKMRKLQPEMKKLQERFKEDKQRLNQEMMTLYKKEGANPLAGCLPILIQIPVFFALYKVLFVSIEMRQTPFYGWIADLSAPDPTSVLNLFGLMPWGVYDLGILNILNIGVWPIAMGATMVLQHRLNPQPPDPVQARIFALMPIIFTFLLAQFPAGLVIYWTWNNLLSILQQMVIMRRHGVPIGRGGSAKTAAPPAPAAKHSGNAAAAPETAAEPPSDETAEKAAAAPHNPPKARRKSGKRRRRSKTPPNSP